MRSKNREPSKAPLCPFCKAKYQKDETPSGICHKCQLKIGIVILIIMVVLAGMVFIGII